MSIIKFIRFFIVIFGITLVSACSTVTQEAGFSDVSALVKQRSEYNPVRQYSKTDFEKNQYHINVLLKEPLTADNAIRIALMNNANLQSKLQELNIKEADLVQATRLTNPSLSYLHVSHNSAVDIERRLLFNFLGILTIPIQVDIEKRHFEQTKLQAASDVLNVAAETKQAFYSLVAAQQITDYLMQVKDSLEASTLLARRMAEVGNLSNLMQARQQALYAEVMADLAQAELRFLRKKERLIRLMGLWGEEIQFDFPHQLPDLPIHLQSGQDLEQLALINRLDIQAMKIEIEAKVKALGLTKATRFINVLELGYTRDSQTETASLKGYEINLEIPLFDWGGTKVAKAQALYMQSVFHLRDLAINARSQVRESYYNYRSTFDIAKHYRDEIIPLRRNIFDESLLRYNGMLISTFELLVDLKEQMSSIIKYIELLENFWITDTELQVVLAVNSPNQSQPAISAH
tara:strand:+ start:40088 stop:41473 length:1386 start_codon:yes stop_codon:yes gene_type:complete